MSCGPCAGTTVLNSQPELVTSAESQALAASVKYGSFISLICKIQLRMYVPQESVMKINIQLISHN